MAAGSSLAWAAKGRKPPDEASSSSSSPSLSPSSPELIVRRWGGRRKAWLRAMLGVSSSDEDGDEGALIGGGEAESPVMSSRDGLFRRCEPNEPRKEPLEVASRGLGGTAILLCVTVRFDGVRDMGAAEHISQLDLVSSGHLRPLWVGGLSLAWIDRAEGTLPRLLGLCMDWAAMAEFELPGDSCGRAGDWGLVAPSFII